MWRIYINPWNKDVSGLKLAFWSLLWPSMDAVSSDIKGDACNEPHNCVHTSLMSVHWRNTARKKFFLPLTGEDEKEKEERGRDNNPHHCFHLQENDESVFGSEHMIENTSGGYVNTKYRGVGQNWLPFIGFNPLEIYLYRWHVSALETGREIKWNVQQ